MYKSSVEKELYRNWYTRVMKGNQRQAKRDRARKQELSAAGAVTGQRDRQSELERLRSRKQSENRKHETASSVFDAHLRPKLLDEELLIGCNTHDDKY